MKKQQKTLRKALDKGRKICYNTGRKPKGLHKKQNFRSHHTAWARMVHRLPNGGAF